MKTVDTVYGKKPVLDNATPLTCEEGYNLTVFYTKYFFRSKYSALKYHGENEDDLGHDFFVKFLEKDFFNKYKPGICSKNYYICIAVNRSFIDKIRHFQSKKYQKIQEISMENPVTETKKICDYLKGDLDVTDRTTFILDQAISLLDKRPLCTFTGESPLLGKFELSNYSIAYHLSKGYTINELCCMFINPRTGKSMSKFRMSQIYRTFISTCKPVLA